MTPEQPEGGLVASLERSRAAEKAQTRYYRSLAAEAELGGLGGVAERLNALHADEQHHLSRLTARLLELGEQPRELRGSAPKVTLDGWEDEARERESREIEWYRSLLETDILDPGTRGVVEEILASEIHHQRELGGKWMPASPGGDSG